MFEMSSSFVLIMGRLVGKAAIWKLKIQWRGCNKAKVLFIGFVTEAGYKFIDMLKLYSYYFIAKWNIEIGNKNNRNQTCM